MHIWDVRVFSSGFCFGTKAASVLCNETLHSFFVAFDCGFRNLIFHHCLMEKADRNIKFAVSIKKRKIDYVNVESKALQEAWLKLAPNFYF